MKLIILVALVTSQVLSSEINPLSDEFINYINSKQNTWIAGRNFDENTPIDEIKKKLGAKLNNPRMETAKTFEHTEDVDIPESFDAREHWPECTNIIGQIADQSNCGSCWAVSAASVMSDRRCIHSKGKLQMPVSALAVTACSKTTGCDGGFAYDAFVYWQTEGIVTGGPYGSAQGCKPYSMKPCEHHMNGTKISCSEVHYGSPKCIKECDDNRLVYKNELTFGEGDPKFFRKNATSTQIEILTNGPVTAGFQVFSDFLNYKSGVYHLTAGSTVGRHAVRIIGWGVENDIPYWLVANSWNEDWGDNGLFKILRGNNEVGIEYEVVASMPKL